MTATTLSTVTDIRPRLVSRGSVIPLQREPGEVIPMRRRHETVEAHTTAQVEKLLFAAVQSDCFAEHPSASEADQVVRRTEAIAYAYAIGIALHPDDPAQAQAVKRGVLGSLAAGVKDVDELAALVLDAPLPPEAC